MKTNPTIIAARDLKESKMETVALPALRSFAAIVSGLLLIGTAAHAQVKSGSNGSDGTFTHPAAWSRDDSGESCQRFCGFGWRGVKRQFLN
jgi:hypothetical protein